MVGIFEKLLEMSITAACVIAVVLVIRLLLRKAPKKYSYLLWAVAAFRLVCPVSFRSVFSIFRFANVVERVEIIQTVDPIPSAVIGSSPVVTPPVTVTAPPAVISVPPTANVEMPPVVTEPATDLAARPMDVAAIIWLAVLVGLLIYGVVSYVRLRRRMANAVLLEGRVYQSDRVRSPFILGFVCPKIYLPFGLTEEQQRYVLAHERYHIRRLDHVVRPVAFLILAVHWFNPLVWAAYYLMGCDMEMSCDEKVLGGGGNIRKAYSTTLLSFAANRRFPSPSPLAFGETGVKGRIRNILNWKKPHLWVTIAAVAVCAVVLVACAADPKEPEMTSDDGFPAQAGYYQPVECVYMSPLGSYAAIDGDSGYWYYVGSGQLKLISKKNSWACPYDAESEWQGLTEELWRELADDTLMFTDPWDTIQEYESRKIRFYEDSRFLLDLDGDLWVGKSGSHPNGQGYIWDLYRLEKMTTEPQILKERKATFIADLNYDGNDEIIEVVHDTQAMSYSLTATELMGGNELWKAEVHAGADGNDCYYLYEKDGKTYLMRWSPNEVQSMCHYSYEVFWFDENGDKQVLAENALRYDIFSSADILKVDLDELRAFESEVNGLLADATMIFADRGEQIGDPDEPVTSAWRSPAEEWERVQSEQASSEILAEWPVDLTQDGQGETLTISKTETEDVHTIKIHRGDYVYWEARLGKNEQNPRLGADVSYWLLEKDGKDYLAEWVADVSETDSYYSYRIFSLTNDGAEVVVQKKELTYSTFMGGFMTMDIKDIRAFANEVNGVLGDADLIASIEDKGFVHNPMRSDTIFRWYADTTELEQQQAEFFGDTPTVHWFAEEGKAEVVSAATDYVEERLAEAGITCGGAAVWSMEEIPTGAVGLWSGNYIYRVQYMLSEYDRAAGEADEQLVQQFYVLTHEEWPWDDSHITEEAWHLMGILTEEELQRFNRAELLEKYGGAGNESALYLAAVSETARQWRELGLCKCIESP